MFILSSFTLRFVLTLLVVRGNASVRLCWVSVGTCEWGGEVIRHLQGVSDKVNTPGLPPPPSPPHPLPPSLLPSGGPSGVLRGGLVGRG